MYMHNLCISTYHGISYELTTSFILAVNCLLIFPHSKDVSVETG